MRAAYSCQMAILGGDERQNQAYSEWHGWLMFFADLQRNDGDLLNFRDRGDKWQTVHSWLLSAGLVAD